MRLEQTVGKMTFANGASFDGMYKDGKREGKGNGGEDGRDLLLHEWGQAAGELERRRDTKRR